MNNKIPQSVPSIWHVTGMSILTPVVRKDIYDVEQSTADLRESEKSQEQVQVMGKIQDSTRSQKVISTDCKSILKTNVI